MYRSASSLSSRIKTYFRGKQNHLEIHRETRLCDYALKKLVLIWPKWLKSGFENLKLVLFSLFQNGATTTNNSPKFSDFIEPIIHVWIWTSMGPMHGNQYCQENLSLRFSCQRKRENGWFCGVSLTNSIWQRRDHDFSLAHKVSKQKYSESPETNYQVENVIILLLQ